MSALETLEHLRGVASLREKELRFLRERRDQIIRASAPFYTERELAKAAGLSAPRVHQIVRAPKT